MIFDFDEYNNNDAHGEDANEIRQKSDYVFVAVADGTTGSARGALAAQLVTELALSVFETCYPDNNHGKFVLAVSPYERLIKLTASFTLDTLRTNLSCDNNTDELAFRQYVRDLTSGMSKLPMQFDVNAVASAQTTLTNAIFNRNEQGRITARYAAWGDSPILLAYPQPIIDGVKDTYLMLQIHGKPLVVQNQSRLYSFIDAIEGAPSGRLSVGSFEMNPNEICLLMTDGVPWQKYIAKDIDRRGQSHQLLNDVKRLGVKAALKAFDLRLTHDQALVDDATLVIVSVLG